MPKFSTSVAPDVANADGTVTRVTTNTVTWQPAEYAAMLAQQQAQLTALTTQVSAMQPVVTQSAAIVAALPAANTALSANTSPPVF